MSEPAVNPVNPYAPPKSNDQPPAPETDYSLTGELSKAARIAGALMIVNGILVAIEFAMTAGKSGPGAPGFRSPLPAIIDILIGVSLVRGNPKYKTWAMVRVCLGAAVFFAISAFGGDLFTAAFTLIGCGALFALLLGNAGKARTIIASVVFGIYLLLEVIGLFSMA